MYSTEQTSMIPEAGLEPSFAGTVCDSSAVAGELFADSLQTQKSEPRSLAGREDWGSLCRRPGAGTKGS